MSDSTRRSKTLLIQAPLAILLTCLGVFIACGAASVSESASSAGVLMGLAGFFWFAVVRVMLWRQSK